MNSVKVTFSFSAKYTFESIFASTSFDIIWQWGQREHSLASLYFVVVVVVVVGGVSFILSRLLHLAFPVNLGLLCMLHPSMEPLVYCPFQRLAERAGLVIHLKGTHPVSACTGQCLMSVKLTELAGPLGHSSQV